MARSPFAARWPAIHLLTRFAADHDQNADHADFSVAAAPGATDNATGSAAVMEAVRILNAIGVKPRRTIRVALWGGEEQGLLGSRA